MARMNEPQTPVSPEKNWLLTLSAKSKGCDRTWTASAWRRLWRPYGASIRRSALNPSRQDGWASNGRVAAIRLEQ